MTIITNVALLLLILTVVIVIEFVIIILLVKKVKSLRPKYKISKFRAKTIGFNARKAVKMMDTLDGVQFENLCCEILNLLGYTNIRKTRTTGDFGLDILCEKDNVKYGIQCKCYSSTIGVDAVQEAFSGCAYYKCDVPVVMTNSYFTDAAQELARVTKVALWSRYFFMDNIDRTLHSRKQMKEVMNSAKR